jgi:hypothetical protein
MAVNLFYLDRHHTRATIPLRPPTQIISVSVGTRSIRRATPRGDLCHLPTIIVRLRRRVQSHGFIHFLLSNCLTIKTTVDKQLVLGGAHVRWNSAGANGNTAGRG